MATNKNQNQSIVTKAPAELITETEDVGAISFEAFRELAAKNEYTLEMTMSLGVGQGIEGVLIGEGPTQLVGPEKVNATTGEVTRDMMRTWFLRLKDTIEGNTIVKRGRLIVRLMGKHGINSFLEGLPTGTSVGIFFTEKQQLGAKQLNKYMTMHRTLIDGTLEKKPALDVAPTAEGAK